MKQSVKMQSRIAKLELQVLKRTCQSIDTPRALTIFMMVEANELQQLLNLTINPDDYIDPSAFADDYMVTELLKKSKALDFGIDREQVAYQKWLEAEHQCRIANQTIEAYYRREYIPCSRKTDLIIARAIQICHSTLGRLTRKTLESIEHSMDFGKGSTASVKQLVTRGRKFTNNNLTTSQRLLTFGLFCLPHLWKQQVNEFTVQDYNELSFVPKNAKTHRAITVETDLNIYVQKGIGQMIKRKLLNLGVSTETQWEVNRRLVARSYRDNLATIDLSSASDTVSFWLVRLFFPDDWFELLCWARPEISRYNGVNHYLEKFSGMGCGFTFEMETLIFHCIQLACKELSDSVSPISTFGDDMICGVDIMEDVITTLSFLGLRVNTEKTFGKGSFHESCGADYFQDLNVRPIYLKFGDFDHEEQNCIYLYCNLLRRYASHRYGGVACDGRFLPAWLHCFTKLKRDARVFVPSFDYENNGIVGNFDEARPSRYKRDDGWSGYLFSGFVRPAVETWRYRKGAYIGSLLTYNQNDSQNFRLSLPDYRESITEASFTNGREAIRKKSRPGIYKNFYTLSWINLGPWVTKDQALQA